MTIFFLHGLDSSGNGTKGRYFGERFPAVQRPDFTGTLTERLQQLAEIIPATGELCFIGSSFGGLMAACYALAHPERVAKLILLAPALNFPDFSPPSRKIATPTLLIIGEHDIVTPPASVLPRAKETFDNLEIRMVDDDHMLHKSFFALDWQNLLKM